MKYIRQVGSKNKWLVLPSGMLQLISDGRKMRRVPWETMQFDIKGLLIRVRSSHCSFKEASRYGVLWVGEDILHTRALVKIGCVKFSRKDEAQIYREWKRRGFGN